MKQLECGHVYACRLSKNGKWLNLTISTKQDGEEVRVCVPICLEEREGKPNAIIDGETAKIVNLKVFFADNETRKVLNSYGADKIDEKDPDYIPF